LPKPAPKKRPPKKKPPPAEEADPSPPEAAASPKKKKGPKKKAAGAAAESAVDGAEGETATPTPTKKKKKKQQPSATKADDAADPNADDGAEPVSPEEAAAQKIMKQVEFYFSEENLPSDKYLLKKLDGDQTVTLDTIMSFKRIKKLSADADTVRSAINQSAIVHVCEDGNRVGRIEPLELEASREEVNDSGTGEEPLLLELSGLAAIVLDDSDDSLGGRGEATSGATASFIAFPVLLVISFLCVFDFRFDHSLIIGSSSVSTAASGVPGTGLSGPIISRISASASLFSFSSSDDDDSEWLSELDELDDEEDFSSSVPFAGSALAGVAKSLRCAIRRPR
jgi:hypothetical protein